jgi:hypothetical protein
MFESAPFTWFTENPTPILILGVVTLAILIVLLLKTGRGVILAAMAGVALLMGLAVLTDKLIVTERERVANVIYDAAAVAPAATRSNDLSPILQCISPSAPQVAAEARSWIGQVHLDSVSIHQMDVTPDRSTHPPTAVARFIVHAEGTAKRGTTIYNNYVGRLRVNFQLENNRWLVTSYTRDQ